MSVSTELAVKAANNRRRLNVGIHKVQFDRIERKTVPSGSQLLEVWFCDFAGRAEQKKTIWIPSKNPQAWNGESLEEAKVREGKRFSANLVEILSVFFPPSEQILSGETWEVVTDKFVKKMEEIKDKDNNKAYVLVHYDKNYEYTEFAQRNWIEPLIEGLEPAFDLNNEYLRMENPDGSSNDTDNEEPSSSSEADSDDLPF